MASKLLDYDRLDPELTPVLNVLPEEMSNITREVIGERSSVSLTSDK